MIDRKNLDPVSRRGQEIANLILAATESFEVFRRMDTEEKIGLNFGEGFAGALEDQLLGSLDIALDQHGTGLDIIG